MTIPAHPQVVRRRTRMPPVYRPPLGLPLRWQDDQSGELPRAVRAFFDSRLALRRINERQLEMVIDYLIHVICAPCWNLTAQRALAAGDDWLASQLVQLRLDIAVDCTVKTADDVAAWIERCLEIGVDPL